MSAGILAGLRVIDLTAPGPGPRCADLLEAQGAEVIRIADRGQDADARGTLALDLGDGQGRALLTTLLCRAQVVLADVLSADRLDEALSGTDHPALIRAQLPDAAGPEGTRTMAFAILAALRHAEATGQGQKIALAQAADGSVMPEFSGCPSPDRTARPRDLDGYLDEVPPQPMTDAEKRALRGAFGSFATGVTVVTTRQADGTPRGFTANSFTSVSLDPPLALICVAKTAHSCATFCEAPHFAVNVLSEDQKPVAGLFASRAADKFDQCDWLSGTADMPLIDGALCGIVCLRERLVDAGDHIILLGRVIDLADTAGTQPLGYFRGNYFTVGLEDDLVSAASQGGAVRLGALVARGRQLLLRVGEDGSLSAPFAATPKQSLPALRRHLDKLELRARLDFLYAIYQDSLTGLHHIYYHGVAEGFNPQGHRFFNLEDIPLDKVASAAERSMLTRYCEEFRHGQFGIYQGDETSGTVHRLAPASGN